MRMLRNEDLMWLRFSAVLGIAFYSRSAQAFMGEENLWWAKAIAALSQQTAELRATGRLLRQQLTYARQTAQWAQEAQRTIYNVHVLKDHPRHWTQLAQKHFLQAYGAAVRREDLNISSHLPADQSTASSDAEVLQDGGAQSEQLYRNQREELAAGHAAALENLAALEDQIDSHGLSAASAPVFTARATSVSAAAHIRSAAALEALRHEQQLESERRRQAAQLTAQARARLRQAYVESQHSWRLQPWPDEPERARR